MRFLILASVAMAVAAAACASAPLTGERPCPVPVPAYSGPPEGFGAGAYRDQQATAPVVIYRVDPRYTSDAFRRKVEGLVTLEVLVRQDGRVGQVRVQKPLDPDLDPNAMCAAAQWRFRPALVDGRPVDYVSTIVLEFRYHSDAR